MLRPIALALGSTALCGLADAQGRAAIAPAVRASSGSVAGCEPGWRPTFGPLPGLNQAPDDLVVFDDGAGPALYAAGFFTSAGDELVRFVARFDGVDWSPLAEGTNGTVSALTVFDDGRGSGPALYAGGEFTEAGGAPAPFVARWDGTSWSALPGLDGAVRALAVFDDGSGPALFAGGSFTHASGAPASGVAVNGVAVNGVAVNGVAVNNVARWDGASWSALSSGTDGVVLSLTVFDDGNGAALHAGGAFTTAGGTSANRVARWDGASWSSLGAGLDGSAFALLGFDDGSGPALYAGGSFTSAGGTTVRNVARWSGGVWSRPGGLTVNGLNGPVLDLAVFDDGPGPSLFAAGSFTSDAGGAANRVARWDGASWVPLGQGLDAPAAALAVFDDGAGAELYVGGSFLRAGGNGASRIARWSGTSWSSLGSGLTHFVGVMHQANLGAGPELYAGGAFTVGGTRTSGIARWNGVGWRPLGSPGSVLNGSPLAMTVFDDDLGSGSGLIVGGAFTQAGGSEAAHVARWNGSGWESLAGGVDNLVRAAAVFDDGSGPALFVGGDFSNAGTRAARRIAKWNGVRWSPLGSGLGVLNPFAAAMTVFDDGRGGGPALYVGGRFTAAGGVAALNIARWDGTGWSRLGSGLDDQVFALTVFDDGRGPALIAGGSFEHAGGLPAAHVARWDGTSWTPLAGGVDDIVWSLAAFDDLGSGRAALFAGGEFTSADSRAASRVARWDGHGWSALGLGTNDTVLSLTVFDDALRSPPSLIVGGLFTRALDSGDAFLARWEGSSCRDTIAPTLTCPDAVEVVDTGAPGESAVFAVSAVDDRDPSPALVCSPASGSVFPPGVTLVTCKAMDASGNQATCEFPVIVQSDKPRR